MKINLHALGIMLLLGSATKSNAAFRMAHRAWWKCQYAWRCAEDTRLAVGSSGIAIGAAFMYKNAFYRNVYENYDDTTIDKAFGAGLGFGIFSTSVFLLDPKLVVAVSGIIAIANYRAKRSIEKDKDKAKEKETGL